MNYEENYKNKKEEITVKAKDKEYKLTNNK